MVLYPIIAVVAAYLIGSIGFAVIFTRIFVKADIRESGSGNAGATNVLRVGGVLPGVLTFLCDALKGFVACFAGKAVFEYSTGSVEWGIYGAFICGVACMLGHVFPVFFQFRGGKGIAVSVGIFAVCCPIAIAIGLIVFALGVLITRIVSLSSIIATVTVVTLTVVLYNREALLWPQALLAVTMGLIVILKHKDNIKRLINRTENKISVRRKK